MKEKGKKKKEEKEDWRSRLQCPMAENKWDLFVQWRLVAIPDSSTEGIN